MKIVCCKFESSIPHTSTYEALLDKDVHFSVGPISMVCPRGPRVIGYLRLRAWRPGLVHSLHPTLNFLSD